MPRGINNWKYKDVVRFLKENGFRLNHSRGSHFYYIGIVNKTHRQVCVPYHGSNSIKPRTIKGIISQSGISKNEWIKQNK